MKRLVLLILGVSFLAVTAAQAAFSVSPYASFGGGDGWLSPEEYSYLTTGGNERAIAFGNGHVYLQSGTATAPTIRILNPVTGAEVGSLDMTGVSGGARLLVGIGVGADGAIYAANLSTALNTTTGAYKVYRWANESSQPSVVYSGSPLDGARLGDSFDVFGSGAATRIAAGYGNSPVVAGNNGFAIIDPTAGTALHIGFTGTPPAAGDFRPGLTFVDSHTVIGDPRSVTTDTRLATYTDAGVGTLVRSLSNTAVGEGPMDYAVINGTPVLGMVETGSAATQSTLRIYDMTDPTKLVLLGSGKTATSAVANSTAAGGVAWGNVTDNGDGTSTAIVYAMNANNGLQAFSVVIPEPGTFALTLLGLGVLAFRRRFRK